ncbi:MAG TPA: DUF4185 domain-containing protein [Thermoanaerobaculia bacterium]|nr:DUF4185 domain-containing protein [Thermoanaerobaculia bacterium]
MTEILPPRVVLPLSECSTEVRLLGLVPGTTVRVTANGSLVAQGKATSDDQTFTLKRALLAGEVVRGKQDFATEGSDITPDGVTVLRKPAGPGELSPVNLVSHLFECGQCIWFDGAFPGATVEMRAGTDVRGSVTSPDGNARMSISKTHLLDVLQASQTACGIPSAVTSLPPPDPLPAVNFRVPAPEVDGPLFACQWQITVNEVFDGATVKIPRGSGDEFACFDRSSLRLNLAAPLKETEKIVASQAFPNCEITSDVSSPPVVVGQPNLPPPFLWGPICAKDRVVRVSGLIPKAQVMFVNSAGADFAYGTAWDSTCDFPMPDLFSVTSLRVKQGLCAPVQWSDLSNEVTLDKQATQGDLFLKVVGPLFDCGRLVHVTGCAPGVTVYLISKIRGGQIGWAYATDYEVDIAADVPLLKDDFVHVEASLCGDRYSSPDEKVKPPQDLRPPEVVSPVHDCGGMIRVKGVVQGATVEVYVNDVFAGSARTAFAEANVPIPQRLKESDLVKARQSLCARTTDFGAAVKYHEDHDVSFVPFSGGHFSERICQLTGKSDPEPGRAHLNDTTNWGVFGTDLGINFPHGGAHYFFFGDEGIDASDGATADADPMFFTTDGKAEPSGFHLHPIGQSGTNVFRRLAVNGFPDLGNFEVPTGGFSWNNLIYLFISRLRMKASFLVKAADPHNAFDQVYAVDTDPVGAPERGVPEPPNPTPSKFINVSPWVIRNSDWFPDVPSPTGQGLLIYGSGWYRMSGVFLAWAPLTPGADPPDPSAWKYFDPGPRTWSNPGDRAFAKPFAGPDFVGEFSVSWIPALRRWVMLTGGVRGFIARTPTGPWFELSAPVWEPVRDGALKKYVHVPGQDNLADRDAFKDEQGGSYGPYMVTRFTKWNPWTRRATLYYVMSTHVPYQVQLMKFQIGCD